MLLLCYTLFCERHIASDCALVHAQLLGSSDAQLHQPCTAHICLSLTTQEETCDHHCIMTRRCLLSIHTKTALCFENALPDLFPDLVLTLALT